MNARKRLPTCLTAAVVLVMGLAASAGAQPLGITCDFSDSGALNRFYAQARDSYAYWTKSNGVGGFAKCSAPYEAGCWQWVQDSPREPSSVQYARLHVESVTTRDFHLEFENLGYYDSSLCRRVPLPDDGLGMGYGRKSGFFCQLADWGSEPRWLETRNPDPEISVWVEGMRKRPNLTGPQWTSTGPRQFDLVSFNNRGWKNITLWVKWYDGNWYNWPDLGRGVHDVSGWAYWIQEAIFASEGPIRLDDIVTTNIQLN